MNAAKTINKTIMSTMQLSIQMCLVIEHSPSPETHLYTSGKQKGGGRKIHEKPWTPIRFGMFWMRTILTKKPNPIMSNAVICTQN